MERIWLVGEVAVSLAEIDFEDPGETPAPDLRERGVRLELRPARAERAGSIYASASVGLAPAFCRIDLLESAPHAADRMHWHPFMTEGEPGDRVFDTSMAADAIGWLRAFFDDPAVALQAAGASIEPALAASSQALRRHSAEIATRADEGLRRAREPWPVGVVRDATGLTAAP